jgi:hypothetical protein
MPAICEVLRSGDSSGNRFPVFPDCLKIHRPGRRLSPPDLLVIENRLTDMPGMCVDLSTAKGRKDLRPAKAWSESG